MNFDDVFSEFIALKSELYSLETMRSKLSNYEKHIKPVIGSMDITDIKYPILQGLLNDLIKKGYAPKSAAHVRDILRTVFEYAFINDYILKNRSQGLVVKKVDNRRFLTLSDIQIKAFVQAVRFEPNPLWRSFFLFLLQGRRLNEAKSLQWSWIDIDRKQVTIPALSSKDRRSHTYGLSDLFVNSLQSVPVINGFVFASPVTCGKLQDVRRAFTKLCARAGIEKGEFRIHDIRHLVGTLTYKQHGLDAVRESLGHGSYQTSLRYVTTDTSKSSNASNFVGSYCES